MTTKELLVAISGKTGFTQKDIKNVIETMVDVVCDNVKNCEEVKIANGITFCGIEKPEHTARNPQNGEPIIVPRKVQIKTKFGARVKNAIN